MTRVSAAIITMVCVLGLTSCKSEEQKAREKLAGTYKYEVSSDNYAVSKTLTLNADGSVTLAVNGNMAATPINGSMRGTYEMNGADITARFPGADGGVYQFRAAGDTIWSRRFPMETMASAAEAANADNFDQPMVRVK